MPVSTSAGISSGVWPSSRTVGILAMAMSYAIAHIGINVLDLDRSVKFYEDVFGMKEVFRMHPKSALDMVIAEASTPAVDGCALVRSLRAAGSPPPPRSRRRSLPQSELSIFHRS